MHTPPPTPAPGLPETWADYPGPSGKAGGGGRGIEEWGEDAVGEHTHTRGVPVCVHGCVYACCVCVCVHVCLDLCAGVVLSVHLHKHMHTLADLSAPRPDTLSHLKLSQRGQWNGPTLGTGLPSCPAKGPDHAEGVLSLFLDLYLSSQWGTGFP